MKSIALFRERASLCLFLLVIIGAPLPFGSTDIWVIAFWNSLLGLSLLTFPLGRLGDAQVKAIVMMVPGICLLALVIHEQVSSTPWIAASLVNPIWHESSELLGVALPATVSVASNQPALAIGAPLACIMSLMCSFVLCHDRKTAKFIFWVIAISGGAYAIAGIVSFVVDPATILGRPKEAYQTVLTGTFINRNTAAAYFGTCAILWLLLICEQIRRRLPADTSDQSFVLNSLMHPSSRMAMLFAIFVAATSALFMTASRAGTMLSLAALILTVWSYFPGRFGSRSAAWLAIAAVALVTVVIWQVLGAGVAERIESQGIVDEGRIQAYRSSMLMIRDYPWLGTGLGTFAWIFPSYRSATISTWGTWDRAHNTLIELTVELGVPTACVILIAWLAVAAILFRAVRIRGHDRIFSSAALSIMFLSGLHSMVDFPLQIPGYAVIAFSIIGMGLAQSFPSATRFYFRKKTVN